MKKFRNFNILLFNNKKKEALGKRKNVIKYFEK